MKRRTYKNFLRAKKLIQEKGYMGEEASEITRSIFDSVELHNHQYTAEFFIDKIIPKEQFNNEYLAN